MTIKPNVPSSREWRNEGFTIIEVLMAVVILSLGLMAYGVTSGSIMTRNTHSTQESISITLAQDKIEDLKGQKIVDLLAGQPTVTFSEPVNEEGGTAGDHLVYQRTTVVTDVGQPCGCFFDVAVTVAWNNNGNHDVTLKTQVSQ